MAKKTVLTSDLTGVEIAKPAQIKVDVNGSVYLLDVDADEEIVVQLTAAGRKTPRRGRPKKTA